MFIYNLRPEFSEGLLCGMNNLFAKIVGQGLEKIFDENRALGFEITFEDSAKLAHYANKNTPASAILFHSNGILKALGGPLLQVCYDGTAKHYLVLFSNQDQAQPRALYDSAIYKLPEGLLILV